MINDHPDKSSRVVGALEDCDYWPLRLLVVLSKVVEYGYLTPQRCPRSARVRLEMAATRPDWHSSIRSHAFCRTCAVAELASHGESNKVSFKQSCSSHFS